MKRFRNSGAHLKAMSRLSHWCDEASYVHWEQIDESIPTASTAFERLREMGKLSKVRCPSVSHAGGNKTAKSQPALVGEFLTWEEKGISLTQSTTFPESEQTTFTFTVAHPVRLKLLLRDPYWADRGATVIVNGKDQGTDTKQGNYLAIDRTWQTGDQVTLDLPMSLHLHRPSDNPNIVAVIYGPLVLAGGLGREGVPPEDKSTDWHAYFKYPDPPVPSPAGDSSKLDSWIKPVAGKPLHFTTVNVPVHTGVNAGKPNDIELMPLYGIHHERYSVYWHYVDSGQTK